MIHKTNRTRSRAERRVTITRVPWPFGLHRRAAVTIGAVCVFALQMRDRRSSLDLEGTGDLAITGNGVCNAERREESP
jgi:hypothetical protein